MMENKDITIIIPLHKISKDDTALLLNALDSIPDGLDTIISTSNTVMEKLPKEIKERENTNFVITEGDTSFQCLVNNGVGGVNTKYFSILEYDDTYTSIWLKNVKTYLDFNPDLSILMCLEDLIDYNENKFIGNGNEAAWASSFSNEIGYLDLDCLENFFDFYMTGSVFNTSDWQKNLGLKPLIKVTFWYEYLLRAAKCGNKIFVMPKVGYIHNLGRKDSLLDTYKETISEKEQDHWFNIAKKDYHFNSQKEPEYYEYSNEADKN